MGSWANSEGKMDFKNVPGNLPEYIKHSIICTLESIFTEEVLFDDCPNPFRLIFDENGEVANTSKIVISDVFSRDLAQVDKRPIIIVKRGPFTFGKLNIGDSMNGHGFGNPAGAAQYMDNLTVSVEITSYARNKIECEDIAWICALFMETFKYVIQTYTAFEKIYPPTTGEVTPVDVSSEFDYFRCDTTLAFVIPFSWEVVRDNIEGKISGIVSKLYKDYDNDIPWVEGTVRYPTTEGECKEKN